MNNEGVKIEVDLNKRGFVIRDDPDTTSVVVDRIAQIGNVSEEAAATLKALCEVMNVDQDALKERMVINALKEKRTIEPSLEGDALEVIERLITERDDYKNRLYGELKCNKEQHEALVDVKNKYLKEIDKNTNVLNALDQCYYILGKFPDKRKYTKNDMMNAQVNIVNQFSDHHREIIKILTEETEQQ